MRRKHLFCNHLFCNSDSLGHLFFFPFRASYFLLGHLLAHPPTQAPKILAEKEGQTSMQFSRESPGHLLEEDALLFLLPLWLLLFLFLLWFCFLGPAPFLRLFWDCCCFLCCCRCCCFLCCCCCCLCCWDLDCCCCLNFCGGCWRLGCSLGDCCWFLLLGFPMPEDPPVTGLNPVDLTGWITGMGLLCCWGLLGCCCCCLLGGGCCLLGC